MPRNTQYTDSPVNLREIIEIRDKLKNDLAVVEKFLEIAKRQGLAGEDNNLVLLKRDSNKATQTTLRPIVDESGNYGSIGKTVLEAIRLCPTEFTVTDVDEALTKHLNHPLARTQIATVLARLTKQSKVQVLKEKHGRKAAIYKRT